MIFPGYVNEWGAEKFIDTASQCGLDSQLVESIVSSADFKALWIRLDKQFEKELELWELDNQAEHYIHEESIYRWFALALSSAIKRHNPIERVNKAEFSKELEKAISHINQIDEFHSNWGLSHTFMRDLCPTGTAIDTIRSKLESLTDYPKLVLNADIKVNGDAESTHFARYMYLFFWKTFDEPLHKTYSTLTLLAFPNPRLTADKIADTTRKYFQRMAKKYSKEDIVAMLR